MKKIFITILLAALMPFAAGAQDARQRTAETIVADALAQLPAQTPKAFDSLMQELAATGADGIRMMAAMLVPAAEGKNAPVEYAINGVVSYVTAAGREELAREIRAGLTDAVAASTDKPNQAFLLSQLQLCATAAEAPVFVKYAADEYLADYAVRGLISTPGTDGEILALIDASPAPDALLAYAAAEKRLAAAEPALLKWAADPKTGTPTKEAVYNALAKCGTAASIAPLAAAAKADGYAFTKTDATGAYVALLARLAAAGNSKAVAAAKEYIAGAYGESYICPYKRTWKTKSATAAQDAHEAIRPSVPSLTPDEVDKSISGDTAKLYRMIWSRFMASQMADCQQDTVSVTVSAADYRFKASGYTVTFDGFTALYEEATDEKEKKETALPPLEQGQVLKLRDLKSEQKFTQPPARYTEATLIKALEENGIGRPSTYAPIITTIIDRGYVERDQKKLKPTLLGRAVDGLMLEQFPHIVDVDFSAQMEKNLDKIESGKADWHKTVDDFYQGFAASLEQAEKNMEGKKVKVPDEPSSEVCDLCGRPMVIKVGKYGKFLACSGFPECRGTKRLVKDTGGICPKCGKGRMLERKSSKGRIYYGCERYPDCDFMTWDMPVPTKCPKCGSTMFRKGSKLYCAKEGCGYEMPVPKKD